MQNEIIIIEKETFYQMIECLGKFEKRVELLCDNHSIKNVDWLDTNEVCKILSVTPKTLQTYRDNRIVKFVQIEGKILYQNRAIQQLLSSNKFKTKK